MTDDQNLTPSSDAPAPPPGLEPTEPPAEHKSVPLWVWIVGGVFLAILLLGLFATQTEQGKLWILGLRGMVAVPRVVGQTQSGAQATLEASGLRLGQVSEEPTLAVAPGTVVSQKPTAGTEAKKDSAVDVSVATIPTTMVPDVVGQTQSDAITMLAEEGLRTGAVDYEYSSSVAAGDVTAQSPPPSEVTTLGSAVNLTVSKGTKQGQVPNVIGLSQDDANSVITAAGFKLTTVKATSSSVPAGDVAAQSPAAGVVADAGSTVTITVSTGAPVPAAATPPPAPAEPSAPEATTPPAPETPQTPSEPTKPTKPVAPTVKVPDVVGSSVREAVKSLRAATLKVSFAFAPSETAILKVIKQDPTADTEVDPGSTVVITIGLPSFSLPDGRPTQPMPLPAEQPASPPAEQPASPPAEQPQQQPAQPPAAQPQPSQPTTP